MHRLNSTNVSSGSEGIEEGRHNVSLNNSWPESIPNINLKNSVHASKQTHCYSVAMMKRLMLMKEIAVFILKNKCIT
jgi:hypothetical protein